MDARIDEILGFWFADPARWFVRDPQLDATIRERFGALHEHAADGHLHDWPATPRGALALVVVLDQFSRNLHRDSPRAFARDGRALATTRAALAAGHDRALAWLERYMLLMPFMHAEDVAVQRESVAAFDALHGEAAASGAAPGELDTLARAADYARRHAAIVERFGRFPHRNATLGRPSSEEELAFLEQPGSSF